MKLWKVEAKFTYLEKKFEVRMEANPELVVIASDEQEAIQRANLRLCEFYTGIVHDGYITAVEAGSSALLVVLLE